MLLHRTTCEKDVLLTAPNRSTWLGLTRMNRQQTLLSTVSRASSAILLMHFSTKDFIPRRLITTSYFATRLTVTTPTSF